MLLAGVAARGAPSSPSLAPRDYFVATNGQDAWSGRLLKPNANGTDGPLASLTGARDVIRQARAATPNGLGPVTVHIRGGTYRLREPFRLEPVDSGTAQAPVVYAAYGSERPVFSGGRVLTGFRQKGPLWECELPEVKAGQWRFLQLFVNGQRRQRARSPNTGYYRVAGLLPAGRDGQGKEVPNKSGFIFKRGDLERWDRLGDVNIVLMHSWETSIHPIKSVDLVSNVVEFVAPLKWWWTIGYWEAAQRYYVENAREALDQPGEWYLDRGTGVLSYWPLPGERLGQAEVVAPVLTELVKWAGNADQGHFVEHVQLRGLAFHHADWTLEPGGNGSAQAAAEESAALLADGARTCSLEGCEVGHVGTYAVWFRRGCQDCRIAQNRLFDLGAGGIRLGEPNRAASDAAESSRNLVDNNHIFSGGHVFAAGVGIWVAQSSYNRIAHNDIHDLLYSGLSIGWNWDDAPNRCHHNLIEFNHVHDLVHGVLSDAGLIYCLGASPGSVIRNNVFHDIWPYGTPPIGWGIYLDATCSGYLVESNLVYNTRSGGLMYNNGGHENVIQNNIFAASADDSLWPYWAKRPNAFRRNIVYLTQGALFAPHAENTLHQRRAAKESLGDWDQNLYWHTGGADQLLFFGRTFGEWQALGLDTRSVVAEPQFLDPARHDFRLKRNSPALQQGFQSLEVRGVGLYGPAAWMKEARHANCPKTVLPPPPIPPKSNEIDDGFENTAVGARAAGAVVSGEEQGARIRVTDERAARGAHSLKITDSRRLQPVWQPHFYYEPHLQRGRVRQSFEVWLSPDTAFFTEWRDLTAYPQNVGPSVLFEAGGAVHVGGRQVASVPVGRWCHVELEAVIGQDPARAFKLTLAPQGQRAQSFANLPFVGRDFHELHWLGFSSVAAADTVFFLDNLQLRRVAPK